MNNGRPNANLMEEIEGRRAALNHLNMIGGRQNYKNFHRQQITALTREINRRAAAKRDRAQRRWKTVRGHVGSRGVVGYLHATTYRPPNRAKRNVGGEGYRRIAGATSVGSPTMSRLMRQLTELKTANRGNKVNIYNKMSANWGRASNSRAAANIMNKAQLIMHRAGLL